MTLPLLSICIPTYNRADIVLECVTTLLMNKEPWIEVVVTDNCSTDDTQNKLSIIKDSRFRYCKNMTNIGYRNFMQSLKNGVGKYCMILSDEDEIGDVDWQTIHNTLSTKDSSVFWCEYYDENGRPLMKDPHKKFGQDQFETYVFAKNFFNFSSGFCLKHEHIETVWKMLTSGLFDKNNVLINLYNHTILAMLCTKYGEIEQLLGIRVHRTERNNKGTLDVRAWSGGGEEPYWSIVSRRKQGCCWFDLIKEMDTNNVCKQKLILHNRNEFIFNVYNYYFQMHDKSTLSSPLFRKRTDILDRDTKLNWKEWEKILIDVRKEMDQKCKLVLSSLRIKKSFKLNIQYKVRELQIFYACMLKMFIKEMRRQKEI